MPANSVPALQTPTKKPTKPTSSNNKRQKSNSSTIKASFAVSKSSNSASKKRKIIHEIDINELPHNLGKLATQIVRDALDGPQDIKNETSSPHSPKRVKLESIQPESKAKDVESAKIKSKKGAAKYGLTPGVSPFPEFSHPTVEECEEVNRLLSTVHGEVKAPTKVPQPSLTVTGCGEVPSVLDALIRTVLSGATTGANSAKAFKGLVDRFGILEMGIGKGSVDWNAVRVAPINEVFEAMKSGGLATTKSKYIKEILNMVYEENLARKEAHIKSEEEGNSGPAGAEHESKAQKEVEIALTDENVLSLDWIHALDKEEAMLELIKFPGIGPKTAACVVLFCLQRPCFAVDTHIFRICKWLGWLPSADTKRVTEITAFSHLEVRIPDHLKAVLGVERLQGRKVMDGKMDV
ncbi:HhH-GPD family base excision DNA repair protein [Talaromyces stipitatus ATCC 10500]|uniref:HhH-GPD family base excision DNA repair protein n=1 Tax=Talaromyces stipitatus (strain ATCC 10500 / CBS 375.48 / QM 6759 / NRRL 1006) TaxID=441959 RepID=B8M4P1_TALSN|nr:HhH-GPD family base excision DNA repair protein [Talaromyces stipitatus ATCC 10500]EED19236.1 HhH-GPD family base excision DNA repair protein [Talaromyces stipitatus ATCC 10500]